MKKQLIIIGIIALLFTIGFSGCNEQINEISNPISNPMIINNFEVSPTYIIL